MKCLGQEETHLDSYLPQGLFYGWSFVMGDVVQLVLISLGCNINFKQNFKKQLVNANFGTGLGYLRFAHMKSRNISGKHTRYGQAD